MCNQCDNTQTTVSDTPSARRQRLRKLNNDPQRCVKTWTPNKKCTKCGVIKHQDDFRVNYDNRVKRYYKSAECLECLRDAKASDRDTIRGRSLQLTRGSKARAFKKGIEHSLTPEWIAAKLDKGLCEVTGIPFVLKGGRENGFVRPFTPSLDRTDPTKGYTADNVKVVCWIYNSAKGVGTHEDVIKLAEALINV